MGQFKFLPELSPEENVEMFFSHLDGIDKEMSQLLKKELPSLFPLPETGAKRNTLRQKFNLRILQALEGDKSPQEQSTP